MPKKILIVDDEKEYARMLARALEGEGYAAAVSGDSAEAVSAAKEEKPDLIIIDIMMPRISGTELRAELLKDPATQGIPILFLTGLQAPNYAARSRRQPVKTIGKSEDLKELLTAIREALGTGSSESRGRR